ncbi:MAG: hypothetical protein SFX18_17525 [Pirellulales bacterium]|nr:hypothetical protein [Pirellulales bacterium]
MAQHQRDLEKEASWRGVLQRFTSSGLSVREFCRREHLTESAFYAWRRTIAERDDQLGERDHAGNSQPAFVPAVVTKVSAPVASVAVELPGGCLLRFEGPTAAELLADLIFVLQARSAR